MGYVHHKNILVFVNHETLYGIDDYVQQPKQNRSYQFKSFNFRTSGTKIHFVLLQKRLRKISSLLRFSQQGCWDPTFWYGYDISSKYLVDTYTTALWQKYNFNDFRSASH